MVTAKSASLVATSRSIVVHSAAGTDSTVGAVTTYFTTFDGSTTAFPLNQQVGAGLILFSGELRPRQGSASVYETDYAVYSSTFGWIQDGSVIVNLPTTDTDLNGLPDFAQVDKAGNVTGTGVLQIDAPISRNDNLQLTLTRSAGAILGNAHIAPTAAGVRFSTPDTTWEVISYSGSFAYTRGAQNSVSISVQRTSAAGTVTTYSATTPFTVVNQNQIALPKFLATGVSGSLNGTVQVLPSTLNRVGKKYIGSVQLSDGDISTSWADFTGWVFEITDNNDADGNGVPDLSDNLPTPPTIFAQPSSVAVNVGQSANFTVGATSSPAPTFQWRRNGVNIPGATTSNYSIASVKSADAGNYDCIVSNVAGSVTSKPAALTVIATTPPTIVDQPVSVWVDPGSRVMFSVRAVGSPTPTYLWSKSGVPIPNATSPDFTIASATVADAGTYTAVVNNSAGTVTSKAATLIVQFEQYTFTTLAGSTNSGYVDATGRAARFKSPYGVAVDSVGNVYVADTAIRKITPSGVVTTFANQKGYGVAVDTDNNVYVTSVDSTILKLTTQGVVTMLAGLAGSRGSADGAGSAARFSAPYGVAADGVRNIYVADFGNNTIRKVTTAGVVTTLAGVAGKRGNVDGISTGALFSDPTGVAVDSADNVYVADTSNHTIRKITTDGKVITLAGDGVPGLFKNPWGVTVDKIGNLYVADTEDHTIRKMNPDGVVKTIGGVWQESGFVDGPGDKARFKLPFGIAIDRDGVIYVADTGNNSIRKGVPLNVPPSILSQPADQTVLPGSLVRLTIFATGAAPLSYQWRKNGANIPGATNATFALENASIQDSGFYSVIVSGATGSISSRNIAVAVTTPPIETIPTASISDAHVVEGNSGTTPMLFTVSLSSPFALPILLEYKTISDSPATAGIDFQDTFGTLVFAPGVTNMAITVMINGDLDIEPDEDFYVQIMPGTISLEKKDTGIGTILNDDFPNGRLPPSLQISSPTRGVAQLKVAGIPGDDITIETSGNLKDWQPLITLPNPQGTIEFGDPTILSTPKKFYRAISR